MKSCLSGFLTRTWFCILRFVRILCNSFIYLFVWVLLIRSVKKRHRHRVELSFGVTRPQKPFDPFNAIWLVSHKLAFYFIFLVVATIPTLLDDDDDERRLPHKYLSGTCAHKFDAVCLSKIPYKLTLLEKRAAKSRLKMVYVHVDATHIHISIDAFKTLVLSNFLSRSIHSIFSHSDSNALYDSSVSLF